MVSSSSPFVSSSFAVGHNVVKSILFRIAGIAVQISVFKLFSLLASIRSAFTAYLMFTEDYVQRTIFIFNRGFTHHAALVLFLTIFLLAGSLYDTFLWGLDAPGYIGSKKNVTVASIKQQMLKRPAYVVFSSTRPGEVDGLDQRVTELMNANLFDSKLNFTLTGDVVLGTPEIVPPTRQQTTGGSTIGPRIWLDKEGLSVSPDTLITFASLPGSNSTDNIYNCPWKPTGVNESVNWDCSFENGYAGTFVKDALIGRPEIHWDDETDSRFLSEYQRPNREDNPWATLGVGGSTAMMKQMFTVTKGNRKHTFLSGAFKICSVHDYTAPFPKNDVYDLIKRSWSHDPETQKDPNILQIAEKVEIARSQNKSFQYGSTSKPDPNTATQVNFEYLNAEGVPGNVVYSLFRISVVSISLVRSETLPAPVQPLESCGNFYHNEATGGQVFGTNCYLQGSQNKTGARFFGQFDTSSVLIMSGTFGDGGSNVSANALNQKAWDWFAMNEPKLDSLVLSRGYMVSIDPSLVSLQVSTLKPAMSYLQVLLVVFPVVLGIIFWVSVWYFAAAHYSSSLLANLYATTNLGEKDTSADPEYIYKMPDIDLIRKDGGVVMATSTGVFMHGEDTDANVTNVKVNNQKFEDPRGSYAPNNNNSHDYESPALLPG